MKYVLLVVRLIILIFLSTILLFFLSDKFVPYQPHYAPPFSIFIMDTLNLFIHEAGHFFFAPFGFTVKLMGGSIFQILFPLAIGYFWYRRDRMNAPYFLFWTGESIINASIYIGDAPFKRLRLISPGALHDWNTVLGRFHMLDDAELMAQIVFFLGVIVCIGSIIAMIAVMVYQFKFYAPPELPE